MNSEELAESKLPRIYDIPIELIDDFPNHPFKVRQDEDMGLLIASIKERGLITPVTLRPKRNGRYEMVSGHRRKDACKQIGLTTIKADIREITCDEATILMVESNLQRTVILPSEKAFAYKMRYEALKRRAGERTDLTGDPTEPRLRTSQLVGNDVNESASQIKRYIRLTELIPQFLELVDVGNMGMRPAVELSYLDIDDQAMVHELMLDCVCTPSHAQAIRIRRLAEKGILCEDLVEEIMREEKGNQKEKIHIRYDQIRDYIPRNISFEETTEYIKAALKFYQEAHFKK
ncbi:MAG: ParB/RepB/Spo0J family partition protein [Saccharofermentans sp.]|nr:ParB/RepB/Spo0J family partition protein [Saccharofermentans sp.]